MSDPVIIKRYGGVMCMDLLSMMHLITNHHEIYTKLDTMLRFTKPTKITPLVSKIMGNTEQITSASLEWGSQQEETARLKFVEIMALKHCQESWTSEASPASLYWG